MNDHPPTAAPVRPELLALLAEAAGAPPGWAERLTAASRLDADLLLDECELAALASLLRTRFGERADLAALRAGLDLDALEALTVGDLEHRLLPSATPTLPVGSPR
ncbi:hypothetical protein [Streptacidiphilus sp. P02-A3a]|uniref:hypothetical protein n=1 Tax=Streptacidiphilus sp. P02-A3a TaxID=2704468 RepID=UPI0015F7BA19|nr:hypothetical protein [Streptacidiphilus sp. P02-A3a]QMU69448.1 hypothetical protein GXP74_15560 [Streptacidiphilus sp. P02-A3a]